jgi:hypothetical protein
MPKLRPSVPLNDSIGSILWADLNVSYEPHRVDTNGFLFF